MDWLVGKEIVTYCDVIPAALRKEGWGWPGSPHLMTIPLVPVWSDEDAEWRDWQPDLELIASAASLQSRDQNSPTLNNLKGAETFSNYTAPNLYPFGLCHLSWPLPSSFSHCWQGILGLATEPSRAVFWLQGKKLSKTQLLSWGLPKSPFVGSFWAGQLLEVFWFVLFL